MIQLDLTKFTIDFNLLIPLKIKTKSLFKFYISYKVYAMFAFDFVTFGSKCLR